MASHVGCELLWEMSHEHNPNCASAASHACQIVQLAQDRHDRENTTALKVPERSLSRVLVEPNPV